MVRGLGAFAICALALSAFEVELRASEPNWTQQTDVLLQDIELEKEASHSSSDLTIYPKSIRSKVDVQKRISTKNWMLQNLKDQLTEEAMEYLIEDLSLYTEFIFMDATDDVYVSCVKPKLC